jgi:hypothetical protein
MLPFNGMTFPRKIVIISEVVPALAWMDTRPTDRVFGICVAKIELPGYKMG